MIVVVGGSSRKAGKTTVVCEIIQATVEAKWTAWKVSSHEHEVSAFGDTARFEAAGAQRALLVPDIDPKSLTGNHILESNGVAKHFTPDLFVFVVGTGEWKPSATEVADKADVVVEGGVTPDLIEQIRRRLRTESNGPISG